MTSDRYDVIIIGTGAGGGTLAHRLAPTGLKILLIERGGWLPREKENWDSRAVFVDNRYKTDEQWLDGDGKPFHPGTHYYVGGNTKVYGAALLRLRERDFGELRHFGGVSPAWPIGYADLAPYYTQAERLYQVRGERGADPTEPPADAPYPFPPVRHEPRIQKLHDDLTRAGLRPYHVPLGIRLDERQMFKSACIRCNTCDGYPCLVDAKSDAEVTCVEPALRHDNVEILTETKAVKLETDGAGRRVTGVIVERQGERYRLQAEVVVSAAGAVNSAALLLRSANAAHPDGLGNSSGVVGRHYMCHNNSVMLVLSKTPNPTVFQKSIAVNDFYFGADDSELPLGHISMVGKSDGVVLKAGAPPIAPGFTLDLMAKHALDFWLTSEDLPHPNNRVQVDADGRIRLTYTPNNVEAHTRLQKKLKQVLGKADCVESSFFPMHVYLGKKIPLAGVAHQCGTVRFGRDPRTSALDVFCKAWDLDNLYVVDAGFFPSSAAVNPGLTIMANALRVGDHLAERLGAARPATVGAAS